jgi:prolyl-tRNA synthetase
MAKVLTSRSENYSQWYQDLVIKADLAENSAVRGCMVIKPYGYAIWEKMQAELDRMFKETGHENAYFPLFIPKSFFSKEAAHVDGFAKECAVVTHYRLKNDEVNGGVMVDPDAKLEEELIVRPTSETIIWSTFKNWIQSYRDLPLLINQWANVVRWEMRTRLFLRTTEFLWQEGHTAHATKAEAIEETEKIINLYSDFAENFMAVPIIKGLKTESERFAGALETYTIEALMQDGKALQSGTSHFLGQNFAKASDIKFQTAKETEDYVWTTSWGSSTRLIGGVIMSHGDDDGIILPPKVASAQVVLLPIIRKAADRNSVMDYTEKLARQLRDKYYHHRRIVVEVDDRDIGGARGWDWIKKGIPLRVEIGPRDIAQNSVYLARRDRAHNEKISLKTDQFLGEITNLLDEIQDNLFARAETFRKDHTVNVADKNTFYEYFTPQNSEKPEIHGGFAVSSWCGDQSCEIKIKEDLAVTIRCIPFEQERKPDACICCGKPGTCQAVFAKAY